MSRNAIARLLQQQGLHVSEGSVGNIIREYRRQQEEQQPQPQMKSNISNSGVVTPQEQQSQPQLQMKYNNNLEATKESQLQSNTTYTADDTIDTTGNPLSNIAVSPPHHEAAPPLGRGLEPAPKNSGCPLQRFLNNEIATAVLGANPSTGVTTPDDAADKPDTDIEAPETKMQVNIAEADVNKIENAKSQDGTTKEESKDGQEFDQTEQLRHSVTLSGSTYPPTITVDSENSSAIDSEVENPPIEDLDARWESRLWRRIIDERQLRQRELLIIQRDRQSRQQEFLLIKKGKQELEEERQQLAQLRQSIDREKAELQQTTPLARQLQAMKVDIRNFIPYVEFLHEYAQQHNTNLTTAAFEIVKNLRVYRELKVLENSIGEAQRSIQQLQIERQRTEQQLAMLNMSTARQQKALSALSDLQAAGFSSSQIAELTGLVSIWNGIGQGAYTGTAGGLNIFGQGNGGGSSGSSNSVNNKNRSKLDV
jgi:hypothetical protein